MNIESAVFSSRDFMNLTQEEVHRLSAEQSKYWMPTAAASDAAIEGMVRRAIGRIIGTLIPREQVYTRMYLCNNASVALTLAATLCS